METLIKRKGINDIDNIDFQVLENNKIVIIKFEDNVSNYEYQKIADRLSYLRKESNWKGGIIILNKENKLMALSDVKFSSFVIRYIFEKIKQLFHIK
jgi:hypothetical protein